MTSFRPCSEWPEREDRNVQVFVVCWQPLMERGPIKTFLELDKAREFTETLENSPSPEWEGPDKDGDWNYGEYYIRPMEVKI